MPRHSRTLLLVCAMAAGSAAVAGTVNVSFINPQQYFDADGTPWDRDSTLRTLGLQLRSLGEQYLPQNQTLDVQVLDIILAGSPSARGRGPGFPRIVRGGADAPRIKLRYTLSAGGQTIRSGEEWVTDLNYARDVPSSRGTEPLHFEKRMLENWFKDRFVA